MVIVQQALSRQDCSIHRPKYLHDQCQIAMEYESSVSIFIADRSSGKGMPCTQRGWHHLNPALRAKTAECGQCLLYCCRVRLSTSSNGVLHSQPAVIHSLQATVPTQYPPVCMRLAWHPGCAKLHSTTTDAAPPSAGGRNAGAETCSPL